MIAAATTGIFFFRNPAAVLPGALTILMGAVLATASLSAYLLFRQFIESRESFLAAFGTGFTASAFFVAAYLVSFPGVLSPAGLFGGGQQTSVVMWTLWHLSFPVAVIAGLCLRRSSGLVATRERCRIIVAALCLTCGFVAVSATAATIHYSAHLPVLIRHFAFSRTMLLSVLPIIVVTDILAIAGLVLRSRHVQSVYLWMSIAVLASMLDAILGGACNRFTTGWYAGKVFSLSSSGIMVVVFFGQITQLYRSLASSHEELSTLRRADQEFAEEALRETVERLNLSQEVGRLGFWEVDLATSELLWSDNLYNMFGVPRETALKEQSYYELVHPDDLVSFQEAIGEALKTKVPYLHEHRIVQPQGAIRWVQARGQFIYGNDGAPIKLYGTGLDITERREAEESLHHLARHDSLTDLPNRYLLQDRLRRTMITAHHQGGRLALLFLDLDRFKFVNDSVGHGLGDQVLRTTADRLTACVRNGDTVSRIGGDEFIVLLEGVGGADGVLPIVENILTSLRTPHMLKGQSFTSSASVGICLYPGDGLTADDLVRNADTAMYKAKAQGGDRFEFFKPHMHHDAMDQAALERDLRMALSDGYFHLLYQPIVNVRSRKLDSVEALLRWDHPEKGTVLPEHFIRFAEQTGLIIPIGAWVLEEALAQSVRWKKAGLHVKVAVNISIREFQDELFFTRLSKYLETTGASPNDLALEITESTALSQAVQTRNSLASCQAAGIRISLDDFGTDYSSLSRLKDLPIDTIKIDKSFIRSIPDGAADVAIVHAILELAQALNFEVVAEGVENAEQLRWLEQAGCRLVQGYFLAEPIRPDVLASAHERGTLLQGLSPLKP